MARYVSVDEWPGSVIYAATNGRLYCATPRGLIPEHPYSMDALRPLTAQERQNWGSGVQARMVIDVTGMQDLHQAILRRTLPVTPWNTYLVLRIAEGGVIVAYRISGDLPRLDKAGAGQVAIASGHDVAGWPSQVVQHFGSERWHFSPPDWEPVPGRDPVIATSRT
jgi:hypothetical protein